MGVNDAHRDGGDAGDDGGLGECARRQQLAHRVVRGHPGAGDGGGAGAAVGLDHVTVQLDGTLAQQLQVERCAQAAAYQALDFLRAAALLALGGFAVGAGVGGARQHAVFGGQPAFAAAALVRRHAFFDRCGAQHLSVAELDQHRAFGVHGVVARDAHRAQRVVGAADAGE
ncbi:hypothetical protein SDC9_134082 [bioreactor metagenome]|uniref:Uncharacterized protein n=1 Tax=bioreactor metagenome TaxID=1076179 RepID=A0A645DCN3_9ZZZZ